MARFFLRECLPTKWYEHHARVGNFLYTFFKRLIMANYKGEIDKLINCCRTYSRVCSKLQISGTPPYNGRQ
ncbi:MAG: hypothetical protein ACFCUV_15910, partial [Rivularia sp. (in: cyanobacteria)]